MVAPTPIECRTKFSIQPIVKFKCKFTMEERQGNQASEAQKSSLESRKDSLNEQ